MRPSLERCFMELFVVIVYKKLATILCKQMKNDLIWQQFCNCCIFYATK